MMREIRYGRLNAGVYTREALGKPVLNYLAPGSMVIAVLSSHRLRESLSH